MVSHYIIIDWVTNTETISHYVIQGLDMTCWPVSHYVLGHYVSLGLREKLRNEKPGTGSRLIFRSRGVIGLVLHRSRLVPARPSGRGVIGDPAWSHHVAAGACTFESHGRRAQGRHQPFVRSSTV
jgi:hypothetical protein